MHFIERLKIAYVAFREPQAVLTGDFVGRIRHDEQGGRFDVRREEG